MSECIRTAVYSIKEKLLLTQLVKKNSDVATVAEKNRAWDNITNSYNSQPEVSTSRTQQQLRKLWNNLKQRKRKETTELRHDMLATGGGPMKIMKPDPVLKYVSETAVGLDVTVNCPWDSTYLFERETVGISSTSLEHTAKPEDAANKAIDELLCDPPAEPVPSTSKGTDERCCDTSTKKELATPSFAEALVAMDSSNMQHTPSKGVATKKGRVLTEEKIRRNRQVEATHQQNEIHNLKKQIAEEELLRVKAERQRAAQLREITEMDLERATLYHQRATLDHQRATLDHEKARLDHQRAADEAELASLKLKQFKNEMTSEDH